MTVALNAAEFISGEANSKADIENSVASLRAVSSPTTANRSLSSLDDDEEDEESNTGSKFTPSDGTEVMQPYFAGGEEASPESKLSGDGYKDKIDYMIHLLEAQRDIRTESATEDLILYGFLGVFIIFVLDNFSRSAKYRR
tara:strand:- start:3443 stop:3865 length:423 start_codon:yes stop_codon:yes gene_type:complete